ncbi:MAG: endonuclease/exonuclease/phosphatase family protein [Planctomycetota bacterium]
MKRTTATAPIALALLAACASSPPPAADPDVPLRLLVYNIRHGAGIDGVVDLERVADIIRTSGANLVLLQEVDEGTQRSGGVDQPAALAELCGMDQRFAPHREFDEGRYGLAALTNLPIRSFEVVSLPPPELELSALELVVEVSGREVVVAGCHLVQTPEQRLAQARYLLDRYEDETRPVVMGGDLNSERTSDVLSTLYTRFDVPEARGPHLTYPANAPVKEIDFVLLSPRGRWRVGEHAVLDEPVASDHRPVLLEASYPR